MRALIFDMDGTLTETEDVHRRAFNAAFDELGLPWHWDVDLNRRLLAVSGGVERMGHFQTRLPDAERLDLAGLRGVYAAKRRHFARLLAESPPGLREGVAALLEAADDRGLKRAVVTAASAGSFAMVAETVLPEPVSRLFDLVITGDDVTTKKPDPQGYLAALDGLGVAADAAIVFEDSPVGFAAARAAGIPVVVTPSAHGPQDGDYTGALAVLPSLAPETWPRFGFPPG